MGSPIDTRVSLWRGRLPSPGTMERPWGWSDLLADDLRAGGAPEFAAFVVRHGGDEESDPEVRAAYATLIRVDAGGDLVIEDRIAVEMRVLSPLLRAERAVSTTLDTGSRASGRIVERGSNVVSRVIPGRGGRVVRSGGGLVARSLSWATHTVGDGLRAVVEAPDRLAAGRESAGAQMGNRGSRRAFFRSILDPYALSREGKAAALFLAGSSIGIALLALTLGVFFLAPANVLEWRAIILFFLLGIGSTILFPFFPELRLHAVANAMPAPHFPHEGAVIAIVVVTLGMTIGGWLVLFLGDAMHTTLRRSVREGSTLERWLDKAEDFARRRGFWAAFLPLAIPLGPDTPVFFLLATVKTPPAKYLAGAFLGLATRFTLYYLIVPG